MALMHLAQALTLFPLGNLVHCKLGYFLFLEVGLYFPRSFLSFQVTVEVFLQIEQIFAMRFINAG